MAKLTKKQFVASFKADAAARPSLIDEADRLCSYLRGYALTINDHTFEEAADMIDDLLGALYEVKVRS